MNTSLFLLPNSILDILEVRTDRLHERMSRVTGYMKMYCQKLADRI